MMYFVSGYITFRRQDKAGVDSAFGNRRRWRNIFHFVTGGKYESNAEAGKEQQVLTFHVIRFEA